VIHEAMKLGKRAAFQCLRYDKDGNPMPRMNGYQYIVSPYYLVNNFGRYYLICNYREKYQALQIFRVDYMMNIEIKYDWPIKKLEDLEEGPKNFSISKYINEHLYILGGDTIEAELELDEEQYILYIKDWFGDSVKIFSKDGRTHAKVRCNENALYFWVMQYSECIKVVSPDSFIEKVKNGLKKALERYEDK